MYSEHFVMYSGSFVINSCDFVMYGGHFVKYGAHLQSTFFDFVMHSGLFVMYSSHFAMHWGRLCGVHVVVSGMPTRPTLLGSCREERHSQLVVPIVQEQLPHHSPHTISLPTTSPSLSHSLIIHLPDTSTT